MDYFTAKEKEAFNVVAIIPRTDKDLTKEVVVIGTPMLDRPYITYLTGHDGSNMATVFNTQNNARLVTGKLDQAARFNLFARSDNYPFFQEFNVPSHTFSTFDFTNFAQYHKVGDKISQVNTTHVAKVIDAIMYYGYPLDFVTLPRRKIYQATFISVSN